MANCVRGFEQFVQGINFAGYGRRRKIVHAFKCHVDIQLTFSGQGIVDAKRSAWFHRFHTIIEIIDVNLQQFTVCNRR